MLVEVDRQEYLDEIRQTVCSRCVECPEGGPPCGPRGKPCGVELHLDQLVEAAREVHSPLAEPYHLHIRERVCPTCPEWHGEHCPCPMDTLTLLVVEAVEAVDARKGRRERGRKFLAQLPAGTEAVLEEVDRAYEEAVNGWTGCDWLTHFGTARLNLQGHTAADAETRAVESIWGRECEEWAQAASWLHWVERQAREAEREASLAVEAAHRDRWGEALAHAHRAWATEVHSGRPLRRGEPTWQRLYRVIYSHYWQTAGARP